MCFCRVTYTIGVKFSYAFLQVENRLNYEHKKELHDLTGALKKKHSAEIEEFMENLDSLRNLHKTELAKLEETRAKKLSELEKEKVVEVEKMRSEIETLSKKHDTDIAKLTEDFEIARKAALLKLKEELNREAEVTLQSEKETLEREHKEAVEQVQSKCFMNLRCIMLLTF